MGTHMQMGGVAHEGGVVYARVCVQHTDIPLQNP